VDGAVPVTDGVATLYSNAETLHQEQSLFVLKCFNMFDSGNKCDSVLFILRMQW